MRALVIGGCLVVGGLALGLEVPEAAAQQPKPGVIKIPKADLDKLVVLHDGKGHIVVIKPELRGDPHFYVGEAKTKTLYQQRVRSGSSDRRSGYFQRSFWAPRIKRTFGDITRKQSVWTIDCGKRRTKLQVASPEMLAKVLGDYTFRKPYWTRVPYALARDDMGTYYYVDRLKKDYGGKGFRIFVGPRGSLKPTKLVNIVSDSEGDIFATKRGVLRLVLSRSSARWVKGKKGSELTLVPVRSNVHMIYAELGVYLGKLGTPCDYF